MEAIDPDYSPAEGRWGRPVQAEIDLSAIASNTRAIKAMIGPRCRVMAVVKANGYGLGAQWVAGAAIEGGASWLAVACVDEGIELRRAGYSGRILIMSYVPPEEAMTAVRNELTLVLHRAPTALALEDAARRLIMPPNSVAVHIKVDTGLGRYGCLPEEFLPLAETVGNLPHLRLDGLMTHFADAENPDVAFAREQVARFERVRQHAEEHGFHFDLVHAANSAGTIALPEARYDMVRCGIALLGYYPSETLNGTLPMRRALTFRSWLGRVYVAQPGDTVGYGRTWEADRPSLIGLVPVGYADGYPRALSNRAEVLVRGRRCPVAGRISMDQVSIDLTGVPEAQEGDEVVLIGRQGDEEVTVEEVAAWSDTVSYEILTGLSERVPRHYIHGGEPLEVCNLLGCVPASRRSRQRKELSR